MLKSHIFTRLGSLAAILVLAAGINAADAPAGASDATTLSAADMALIDKNMNAEDKAAFKKAMLQYYQGLNGKAPDQMQGLQVAYKAAKQSQEARGVGKAPKELQIGQIRTVVSCGASSDQLSKPQVPKYLAVSPSNALHWIVGRQVVRLNADGSQTVVAGISEDGPVGDGGPAVNARLTMPSAIAFAPNGDLYIADQGAHCIRKVQASDGVISTCAGDGTIGGAGNHPDDGGPAIKAKLGGPSDLRVDTKGNIYVLHQSLIRKIDAATGNISTVMEGASSKFALDVKADILSPGNRISRYIITSQKDETIAGARVDGYGGDGKAGDQVRFKESDSVVVDANGDIYVADTGNNRIRKISGTDGIVSTVVGSTTPVGNEAVGGKPPKGYSGDGGPANSALLDSPESVALDGIGNLYFIDRGNKVIRMVKLH
ncbi:MAG: hypothetical protein J0M02_01010 [Planctomycetes bacterium]|nr:hypothetical protein [Planctomycetota bacterium]